MDSDLFDEDHELFRASVREIPAREGAHRRAESANLRRHQ